MACKYYLNGNFSELYTDLFGYLDNTLPENKKTNDVYRILKKHRLAVRKDNLLYLNQSNWERALREVKRINKRHPGLLNTTYLRNTARNIYYPAAELHALTINEGVLKNIELNPPKAIETKLKSQVDIDQYVRFVAGTDPNTRDYYLDELARRENTSNSKFSNLEREDLQNVYKVVNHLKNSFAKIGINVDVELSTGIEHIGQVDYQEGENPIIKINPELVTKDTTYHEFGHIYIDLLGVTNPTIIRAFEQLRDTELYEEVKATYPELEGILLDKEVLATAIGIEGAKITRKNPNKLQRLLNRIFRAIGKVFGITPNQAAILAEEMFAQELRISNGRLTTGYTQFQKKSKDREKFERFVIEAKVKIEQEIQALTQKPTNELDQTELAVLRRLENGLRNVEKVEDLFKLVDAMSDTLLRAKSKFDAITSMTMEDQGQIKILSEIWKLKKIVNTLEEFRTIQDLMMLTETAGNIQDQDQFQKMESKLSAIIKQGVRFQADFSEKIIPMWAQAAIGFTNSDISPYVQDIISTMERTKKLFSPPKLTNDWAELQKRYKDGQITIEELREKELALTIDHWKRKDIKGYADLVAELQAANRDKSIMSLWVDPLHYSSDRGIQLMIKMVDEANLQKNDMMLKFKSRMAPAYEEFTKGRDQSDVAGLNDPLIEIVTLKGKDRLAFVNPYDIKQQKENQKEYLKALGEKFNMPKQENYLVEGEIDIEEYRKALYKWYKTASGANYIKGEAEWTRNNTHPKKDWKKDLERLNLEIREQNKIRRELKNKKEENTEAYLLAGLKKAEWEKEKRRNYIEEYNQPKGDWVRPSTGETYRIKNKEYKKTDYTNKKYTAIQKDPRLKKYYDYLLKEYREQQEMIGLKRQDKHPWETHSYLLPTWRKLEFDRLREQGIIKGTADFFLEAMTMQETDYDFYKRNENIKDVDKEIPVYGVSNVEAKDVSKDLAMSIYNFGHQAFNYKTKSIVHGPVMTYQDMLKNREWLELNSASIATFDWVARRLGVDLPDRKEGENYTIKHVTGWLDAVMFGQKHIKNTFTIRGKEFEANKIASGINAFTAVSTLAANGLQGANQFILDNLTMAQEAFAGEFFSKSDLAWAKAQYWGSGMAVTDIGRFNPKSKIGKAVEYFDALTEFTDREGNRLIGSKLRKAMRAENLLIYQQGVEYELSATRLLAMLKDLEGKLEDKNGEVILNEEGKPANLYDLLLIDKTTGVMSIDPRVANFNRRDFIARLHGLSRRTNQTKGEMAHTELSRRWLGKLVGLFRGWMVPGYRRRFGHGNVFVNPEEAHIDEELGTVTQGMYISFWNFMYRSFENLSKGTFKTAYGDANLIEQQNIKRSLVEFSQLLGSTAIIAMLLNIDDDEETWLTNFMLYQAKRYQAEILQWTPLVGANEVLRLIKSPTATVNPFQKGLRLIKQMAYEGGHVLGITPDEFIFYQRRSGKYAAGDRKIKKMFADLFPVWRGLSKTGSPREAYKWFTM